ncbi:hypothetical protein [uncultured Microscilla sp.]|uniref:hypothetical protein n=1 Tax=uncultured Microscilla sp. TaxID=432653 RepID=UPI00261CD380|nr:hypothetical protein [uncultured Microscilla sp.]
MIHKNLWYYIVVIALLGACVPSKKYKSLEAKYNALNDSTSIQIKVLEANNTILRQELDTLKKQRAVLEQKNATLRLGNEKSVAMLNKMMRNYTVLESEHITLLKNSAQEASFKKKMLAQNQEKLVTSSQLLRKYRQQIFKLQNQLTSQKQVLKQNTVPPVHHEDDNPVDLRSRIMAKIPPQDRKYFDIDVDNGKVYIEIVDSVLFEPNQNKLTPEGEALLANLKNILKGYNLAVNDNDENAAENGKQNHRTSQVNRILQSPNGKKRKTELPTSTIDPHKNATSLVPLKGRKKLDKSPKGKTLIVVSEQD